MKDSRAKILERLVDGPPEHGEAGYGVATSALKALIDGRIVFIDFGADGRKRDNWGRLLCSVRVDGQDVGQVRLERGLAEPYR